MKKIFFLFLTFSLPIFLYCCGGGGSSQAIVIPQTGAITK